MVRLVNVMIVYCCLCDVTEGSMRLIQIMAASVMRDCGIGKLQSQRRAGSVTDERLEKEETVNVVRPRG